MLRSVKWRANISQATLYLAQRLTGVVTGESLSALYISGISCFFSFMREAVNALFSFPQMMCWKVSSPQESDRRSVRKVKDDFRGYLQLHNFCYAEISVLPCFVTHFYDEVLLWRRIEALYAGIIPTFIWFRV